MNIEKAFSFVFQDKQWVSKVLIGGLMLLASFTVVLAPFLVGYAMKVMGRAARGEKEVLPAWENWGELYVTGLVAIAIHLIYGVIMWVAVVILKNLPILKMFVWVVNLASYFYIGVAVLFYAVSGKFEDAFAFGKINKFISINFVNLIVIWLVSLLLIPVTFAGLVIFLIGIFFTAFFSLLVRSYLYGDLYRTAKK